MDDNRFLSARTFLHAEARLLERRLFEAQFEAGDPDAVIDTLRGYRNPDGGFGHGLEPDKRVPESQPLDVEIAFAAMDQVGRVDDDLVSAACGFLQGRGPGVGCVTAAYSAYPRAPHWEDWATAPSINPTGGLAALLWKWGVDHPWREAATAFCWEQLEGGLPGDAHSFGEALSFLAHVGDRQRADGVAAAAPERVGSLSLFHLDPSAADYGLTPLHFAPAPDSRWAALFTRSVIDAHLDALEGGQCDDGGWPISWVSVGPAATAECRGTETLRALRTLRAWGRLG